MGGPFIETRQSPSEIVNNPMRRDYGTRQDSSIADNVYDNAQLKSTPVIGCKQSGESPNPMMGGPFIETRQSPSEIVNNPMRQDYGTGQDRSIADNLYVNTQVLTRGNQAVCQLSAGFATSLVLAQGPVVTFVKAPGPALPHAELLRLLPKKEKSSVYGCRYRQPAEAEIPATRPAKRSDGAHWDRWMRTRRGSKPDIEARDRLLAGHYLTRPGKNYLLPDLYAEYQQVCSSFNHMNWTKAFTSPLKYIRWRFGRPQL